MSPSHLWLSRAEDKATQGGSIPRVSPMPFALVTLLPFSKISYTHHLKYFSYIGNAQIYILVLTSLRPSIPYFSIFFHMQSFNRQVLTVQSCHYAVFTRILSLLVRYSVQAPNILHWHSINSKLNSLPLVPTSFFSMVPWIITVNVSPFC